MTGPASSAARPRRVVLVHGEPVPEGTVDVGEATCWRNPFKVGVEVQVCTPEHEYAQIVMTPQMAVACYANDLHGRLDVDYLNDEDNALVQEDRVRLAALRGRDLGCTCPADQPCHADLLLERANRAEPV